MLNYFGQFVYHFLTEYLNWSFFKLRLFDFETLYILTKYFWQKFDDFFQAFLSLVYLCSSDIYRLINYTGFATWVKIFFREIGNFYCTFFRISNTGWFCTNSVWDIFNIVPRTYEKQNDSKNWTTEYLLSGVLKFWIFLSFLRNFYESFCISVEMIFFP